MNGEHVILNIIGYLNQNLQDTITIDNIAGKFHFNRFYLMKLFKKVTGITILEYVNRKKVIDSFNDLLYTDEKLLKIALKHGFNSLEYYSETFYKVVGVSPNNFRKINPNILLEGDDLEVTRLEQLRKDMDLLKNVKASLLVTSAELRRVTEVEPVNSMDKPKIYLKVRKDKKAA